MTPATTTDPVRPAIAPGSSAAILKTYPPRRSGTGSQWHSRAAAQPRRRNDRHRPDGSSGVTKATKNWTRGCTSSSPRRPSCHRGTGGGGGRGSLPGHSGTAPGGAQIGPAVPGSPHITGTIAEWASWTQMRFPGPVTTHSRPASPRVRHDRDRNRDLGEYRGTQYLDHPPAKQRHAAPDRGPQGGPANRTPNPQLKSPIYLTIKKLRPISRTAGSCHHVQRSSITSASQCQTPPGGTDAGTSEQTCPQPACGHGGAGRGRRARPRLTAPRFQCGQRKDSVRWRCAGLAARGSGRW